jgi:L-arabinokinase
MRLVSGTSHGREDAAGFLATLDTLAERPERELRELLLPGADVFVARAPGRLDVMGGIADYSGSLVLQLPLREATFAAVQRDPQPRLRVVSLGAGGAPARVFEAALAAFERDGQPIGYAEARALFERDPATSWAAYVAGAFLALARERGVPLRQGARILVASEVPSGRGVSSSAALEVAAMTAVAAAFDVRLQPREVALLCQVVENRVVGAPCGIMDQMAAVFGQPDRLMALLCQPAELREPVALPEDVALFGIDSGISHAVSGADYVSVRVGAFMGYRILAELAGLAVRAVAPGEPLEVDDPEWGGYLANLTPSSFHRYAGEIPLRLRGSEFLDRFGGTTDAVTRVDPEREYAVRVPAAHPVHEGFRVAAFAELLAGPPSAARLRLLGELMRQSHCSYSDCGLGSAGTDRLVELVRAAGAQQDLYGAKITGGGSGGTIAVLGRRGPRAEAAIAAIAATYADETGRPPKVFSGSSPGAAEFGCLRLAP